MLMQILIWLLLNLTLSLKLRELFAKMIKKYDLPYTFAVYDYVRHWLACVCSTYNIDTRSAIDYAEVFKQEKEELYSDTENNSSRVSLTTDLRIPQLQAIGHCCACHYIDDEWTLNRKIIAFHGVNGHILVRFWMNGSTKDLRMEH